MSTVQKLVLASQSPRRKELLTKLDLPFTIRILETDEDFPSTMPPETVAQYLATQKAEAQAHLLQADEVLLAADTTVLLQPENKIEKAQILNKPQDAAHAKQMLEMLAGRTHWVVTGVCLKSQTQTRAFSDIAEVTFASLSDSQIAAYIAQYQPFDKAGAYGAQDWIGLMGIEKIVGSYFTIMGLPTHLVYANLLEFFPLVEGLRK
ncbi:Maf family nucleotide pyrophosphatase [Hugenholtzia roseola]|uniref:Maf family nucleotide pyrophosphatase n=1 Tax=Hugenholtzia roseola TaxID=1002 RepID=UPI0004794A8D|nr:Maf family nucleotide pyrophosphatase [Hugenholtzia roseola]